MEVVMINLKENQSAWYLLFMCWVVAFVATAGSLFFSQVMGFPPCELCWYQRIFMYPLVIFFVVSLINLDASAFKYSLPLAILGWLTALYHNLLHYGIVPESATPCREGVSCADIWINWLGFITIPMLSFIAFSLILIILTIFYRRYLK
ncbi:MAG: disulfide bond formation protein B [Halobacteriovorax sp. JY17]|nr:MAG: disulfide bond formation protein B [Halobacteriovorax sp. JY17]